MVPGFTNVRRKRIPTLVWCGTLLFVLTNCGVRKYSTQEILNGIYETSVFDEGWEEVYSVYKRSENPLNYYVFNVADCKLDKTAYCDEKDAVFEKYYFLTLEQLESGRAVDEEYRFVLDEPYLWLWLYGSMEIFNYAEVRDVTHVERYLMGSVFIVYLENVERVITLEIDYH